MSNLTFDELINNITLLQSKLEQEESKLFAYLASLKKHKQDFFVETLDNNRNHPVYVTD